MPVVRTGFGDVPLYFEENRGQSDLRARYIARGRDGIAFIENDGLMLAFGGEAVEMRLANANGTARPEAEGEIEGVSNYYLGKLSLLGLRHYPGVRVRNVRPGVDIFYHGDGDRLEYDLEIHPGAAPDELKLVFSGAKPRLAENGDLVFDTPSGELRQQAPKVWQITDGRKRAIECRYRLATSGEVRLELSPYDRRADLVIDPVLSYSTYLSGSNGASPAGIAVDSGGSAFVIGQTYSSNFPVTTGPPFSSSEAFVTKFNHSGKGLVYSTFIVGSYSTTVTAVAVDSGDNAYVTGSTNASTFPFTIGQLNASGLMDAYVLKLGPTGNVVYGTDLGGNQSDFGNAIAVDASGEAFVAGSTSSNNFPTTTGVFHATRTQTSSTGFVAKLNSTGQISYATYLGGTNNDNPTSIAVDASGNAYIEGTTNSQDFPTTSGALSTALDGSQDAFVAKINPTGSALVYSTYLGGSSSETGGGLAIDAAGDCYVTGTTNSTDFPVTAGAFATSLPQFQTGGFVTKLNATGTALVYSTYLQGPCITRFPSWSIPMGLPTLLGPSRAPSLPLRGPCGLPRRPDTSRPTHSS